MSYLRVNSVQGELVLDVDRIGGVGEVFANSALGGQDDAFISVALFLSGYQITVYVRDAEQKDKLIEAVKDILNQRKIRQPMKVIEV